MSEHTDNSIQLLLDKVLILYNSATQHLNKIQEAINTTEDTITYTVDNPSGVGTSTHTIPSMKQLERRMGNLEGNIDQLTKIGKGGTYAELVDKYGKVRQLFGLEYKNTPIPINIEDVEVSNELAYKNDINNPIHKLFSHNIIVGYTLNDLQDNVNSVRVSKITIDNVFIEAVNESVTSGNREDIINFLDTNNIQYEDKESIEMLEARESRFYGDFAVLNNTINSDGTITLRLNSIKYNDRHSTVLSSKELTNGTKLINESGKSVFTVTSVNNNSNVITVTRTLGTDSIKSTVNALSILDDLISNVVNVGIQYNEVGYVFFAPIHKQYNTTVEYSNGILFDSDKLTIEHGGIIISLNKYFEIVHAVDIGDWLIKQSTDSTPPSEYAIVPDKPVLSRDTFKVVHINKHLIEATDVEEVEKLMQAKVKARAVITKHTAEINKVQTRLNTNNFVNNTEKKSLQLELTNRLTSKRKYTNSFNGTVRLLNEKRSGSSVKEVSPKYRVRGFWAIPEPKTSNKTKPQQIIKYNVRYRYLSVNSNLAESQIFSVPSTNTTVDNTQTNSEQSTASFSTWNTLKTETLNKIVVDGVPVWETQDVENTEQININQIDIPIRKGEILEFQVQAVSEIGYPNVAVTSEWSDIMEIRFPDDLSNIPTLADIDTEIQSDLRLLEFEEALESRGLIEHISDSFIENNIKYRHTGNQIASGFFSENSGFNISVFDKMREMDTAINRLNNIVLNIDQEIGVSVINDLGNEQPIINNGIIHFNAGYYTNEVGENNNGAIVSKQFYIKIENTNLTPLQMYSMIGHELTQTIDASNTDYYNVPVGFIDSSISSTLPEGVRQFEGQVIYSRYTNVANTRNLYQETDFTSNPTNVQAPVNVIGTGTTNAYHMVGGTATPIEIIEPAVQPSQSYIAMADTHPLAISGNTSGIEDRFVDIANSWSPLIKSELFMEGLSSGGTNITGFEEDDRHLIGDLSCGAYLYMNAIDPTSVQVKANRMDSFRPIRGGESNSLLIPFMFEYRMTDALGNIDGLALNGTAKPKYSKTIGFDFMLLGKKFRFDVNISASYSGSSTSADSIPALSLSEEITPIVIE